MLPGSDYIGPFNDIKIDAPRNEADAIAKEHDSGYERVSASRMSHDDHFAAVQKLDDEAIAKFADYHERTGNLNAFIGKVGLRTKSYVENRLGRILYPSHVSGKI